MKPLSALLAAWCLLRVNAALRRAATANSAPLAASNPGDDSIGAVKAKWDQMDHFLEIMFTIACQSKHGKDVNGFAAEKLQKGELKPHEVEGFKKKIQAGNVQMLVDSCGKIVATGQAKCRQSCADRWGEAVEERAACDKKCVTSYNNFEMQCQQKAEHLEQVYSAKLTAASSRTRCLKGHCQAFPTVWLKDSTDKMKEEVDIECSKACTEDHVKQGCERKWQLEVDFVRSDLASTCHAEGKVKECFDEKKAPASTKQEECAAIGKSSCEMQHSACTSAGKVGETFGEAKDFCDSRLTLCQEQVSTKCLDDHKKDLDTAQTECEKADEINLKDCIAKALEQKGEVEVATCTSERFPNCSEECHGKCDVDKMEVCLANLDGSDPAQDFCKDFWRLLHESSEVDPVTGTPIVLLAPEAVTFTGL